MAVPSKPILLFCCTPVSGHLNPLRTIAKAIISRGYDVTFCTGSAYRDSIEGIGATFIPLEGYCDFTEGEINTKWPARNALPAGPAQLAFDLEKVFIGSMASQWESQQKALKALSETNPGRSIVLVSEGAFLGSIPTFLGAPGIKPSGTVSFGIIPLVLSSIDLPPFGLGLHPDPTPEGREKNKAMTANLRNVMGSSQKLFIDTLDSLGASKTDSFFLDTPCLLPDRFVQMCPPSFEYPRSDAPSSLRFAGGLPRGNRDPMTNAPSWWEEISANTEKKKIVFLSQGTVAMNYEELIIPTLTAFKDSTEVIVVVALGKKGAKLPAEYSVPANARIGDYVPFDHVLPLCDVFVTNGGYGGVQHSISNGIPLVVGGATEDKPETAARAEWCGIGINLKTATPRPEAVKQAVETIFSDPKYKKRTLELQREMESYDPVSVVMETINGLL